MTLTFLDRFRPRQITPASAAQVFDGLAQVRAYWEALRVGGALPGRAGLDPRGLSGMLDRVFLAERIGRGLAQIRLAGSGLTDFAGADLRGLPLSCLFAADSRPLLAQSLERVFAEPAVAELDLGADRGRQGQAVARLLLLPLAEEGEVRPLLGAFGFAGPTIGPCKFQLLARREERIAPPAVVPLHPAFAPEETVLPGRRRGHLTLVHFNE